MDITVPGDGRVEEKKRDKQEKYQDLARDIRKLWKTSVNDKCGANCGWRKRYRGLI